MSDLEMIPAAKPIIGEQERAAVDAVLRSGMVAQGPQVAAFEEEFARELVDGRTCVAVNSGTSGLHLGLLAAGIGAGDEVIVPSFTFAATANSVALTGARPVFADITEDTFNLDPESVRSVVTDATAAIMPVHLYGHPADMAGLAEVADEAGVMVFEDAAQAHGARIDGAPVGSFGTFGMFSLYPTKNMTSGEGGMVACADEEIARGVRLLRNQGMETQYANEVVGLNNRMTDLHAAIGRVQLGKLSDWTARRRENAAWLDAHLEGVVVPPVRPGCEHVYHQYTVRLPGASREERDAVVAALREEHKVGCGVYYPIPNHELVSLARFAPADPEALPVTARAAAEVFSLPVHPSLTAEHLERIATAVNTVVGAGS
ncbi:DegT/DnrJ/EryC1/StrS family aminotransferase [Ornithinicoccus hortensis]|uniref:dTDP-4-amino-4,6-dideoxygalactose transaminase n=1 Tax=Ornithinicoccus hortensis TaxID=82346 RepID=A0A542YTM0_9MICO|nr:DegT/DnrJ/EryC1/StrS family aminotransferase [Ornithinicoccus hortensis]TQL51436.1 dTDP-4-amino-4,6-dideoxygalactose transaminase [Ornithinicoccus hortensis]